MRLIDLLNAETVKALPAEDVGTALLQLFNAPGAPSKVHFGGTCQQEAAPYGDPAIPYAIAAALNHLLVTGMIAPSPSDSQYGWFFVTPRGRAIRSRDDYEHFKKASLYPRGNIHPTIEAETYSEFLRGDYDTAVFKAFKAVEVAIRPHVRAEPHVVGRDLMAKAFNEGGRLTEPMEVRAERESLMELFRGAFGRFKNPTSHREIHLDDPAEALEILQLASLLMRIVDSRIDRLTTMEAFSVIHDPSEPRG